MKTTFNILKMNEVDINNSNISGISATNAARVWRKRLY